MPSWKQHEVLQCSVWDTGAVKESLRKQRQSKRFPYRGSHVHENLNLREQQSMRASLLLKMYRSHLYKNINGTESPWLSNGKATAILQSLFRNNQDHGWNVSEKTSTEQVTSVKTIYCLNIQNARCNYSGSHWEVVKVEVWFSHLHLFDVTEVKITPNKLPVLHVLDCGKSTKVNPSFLKMCKIDKGNH